jgi:hypothetical protein
MLSFAAMTIRDVHWLRAIGGAVLAEAAQIAAAFLWVAVYSYIINPGQPLAVYQQHAQDSGPWVSIIAGFVIFYAVSRWIARSVPTAIALFVAFLIIDGLLLILASPDASVSLFALAGASYATKLLACYAGGRHGAAPSRGAQV